MSPALAFAAGAAAGAGAASAAACWKARRRREELGRLLSFAAHEINTPVTAVNMTVINCLSGVFGEPAPSQQPWLELAREQMGRLNGLVGELRDFVHLRLRGDFRPMIEDARPEDLLSQAVVTLKRGFEQAGAKLELDVPPGLPDVRTDPDRAARSLASLLFHARKFRLGGPVRAAASAAGGEVRFEIRFAGPRLSPEQARASLEVEYPGRRRSDQVLSATGMGLGIVRAVAERMGGRLELAVADDGASRLELALPAAGAAPKGEA